MKHGNQKFQVGQKVRVIGGHENLQVVGFYFLASYPTWHYELRREDGKFYNQTVVEHDLQLAE